VRPLPVLGFVAVIAATAAAVGLGFGNAMAGDRRSADERARAATAEFFRALNAGRYDHVCRLLSDGYYEHNKVRNRRECALGLRATARYAGARFRITGVETTGGRATVTALANGAPGRVELVRERGRYRVLAVRGD
jgi:hypothetical protein